MNRIYPFGRERQSQLCQRAARFALKALAVSADAGVRLERLRPANGRRGVGGQREHRRRRRQDDDQPVEPERGDQLAELQHRTGGSGPVRAAQQQFGRAQPGAGFGSFEHPRQPVGQRQGVPGQSERHPVRQGRAGERGRAGRVHPATSPTATSWPATTSFPAPAAARVVNQGSINADGGYVALLGANVSNQGVISAKLGTVALAAGNAMTLDVAGDGLLNVAVNQGAVNALAQNGGLIQRRRRTGAADRAGGGQPAAKRGEQHRRDPGADRSRTTTARSGCWATCKAAP